MDDFHLTFTFNDESTKHSAEFIAFQVDITYRRLQQELKEAELYILFEKNKAVSNSDKVIETLEAQMADVAPTKKPLTHQQVVKLGVDYAAGKTIEIQKS